MMYSDTEERIQLVEMGGITKSSTSHRLVICTIYRQSVVFKISRV